MSHFLKRLELNGFKSFAGKTVLEFPAGIVAIVGPNGSGKCLKGDSLVFLADGRRIAIRDLVSSAFSKSKPRAMDDGWCLFKNPEGVRVFSLNPASQELEKLPVAAFVQRKAPEHLLHIKTRSGKEITATPYHPLFVLDAGTIKALRADELTVGVKIATPREYKLAEYKNELDKDAIVNAFAPGDLVYVPYSVTLKEYLNGLAAQYGGMRALCAASSVAYESVRSINSSQGVNVAHMNLIAHEAQKRGIAQEWAFGALKSKGTGSMKVPQALDRNLARFLGYVISEGRVNKTAAQVWFVNSDPALVKDFQETARAAFGLEAKLFSYKAPSAVSGTVTKDAIIFSKVLTKFLDRIFGLKAGGSSFEKTIPEQMFSASPDVAWEFVSALFEGDGHFHFEEREKKHQLYVEYATASRELAFGLQTLLLREGVQSRVKAKEKCATNSAAKTKRTYYSVFISGAPNLKILFDNLHLVGEKNKKLEAMKAVRLAPNPNIDVISVSGVSPLIKDLVKATGISVKKIRKISPKLATYYEGRCDVSREGIREVIDVIRTHVIAVDEKTEGIISQLERIAASDVAYDEVISIEKEFGEEWVYDLCVEKNHSFIANDIIVHNSNIVDALRWLLGERDAKNLRGAKVEDLIFAGTQKRPRVGMANASLHFENRNKFFPVDYEEVAIKRQISRGGESKYFLNQSEVLLRDLVDFFAKARMGSRGLIIIGQGDSDLFIRSTPMERREMIEELLGLREYQLKKSDAERRLKNSRINLDKTKALIEEILPHLRSLKRQTNRWERRGALEEELKTLEEQYFGFQLKELAERGKVAEQTIAESKKKFEVLEAARRDAEKRQAEVEASQPEEKKQLAAVKAEIQKLMERRSALQKDIGRLEAQIELAESQGKGSAAMGGDRGPSGERLLKLVSDIKEELDRALQEDALELQATVENILEEINDVLLEERSEKKQATTTGGATNGASRALQEQLAKVAKDLAAFDREIAELREKEKTFEQGQEGFYKVFKAAVADVQAAKNRIIDWENENREHVLAKERVDLRHEEVLRQMEQAGRRAEDFANAKVADGMHESDLHEMERRLFRLRGDLASMGEVDHALMKEAQDTEARYAFLTKESEDLEKAVADLVNLMQELSDKIKTEFDKSLAKINEEFGKFFALMFGGGTAKLRVEKPRILKIEGDEDTEESDGEKEEAEETMADGIPGAVIEHDGGVNIDIRLPRKKVTSLDMLSGGERSLVGIAALFAMVAVSPPPFLVLDEIDAPLDERNARRFGDMLKEFSKRTQFLVVTHNRATMEAADILYGVTLDEDGSSKIVSLKLEPSAPTAE